MIPSSGCSFSSKYGQREIKASESQSEGIVRENIKCCHQIPNDSIISTSVLHKDTKRQAKLLESSLLVSRIQKRVGGHPKGLQLAINNQNIHDTKHHIDKTSTKSITQTSELLLSISVQQCDALFDQHRRRGLGITTSLEVNRKLPCTLGERQTGRPIQAQPVCRHGFKRA